MTANGDTLRIDENGRLAIPQRVREQLHLEPGDPVRVDVEDGTVVVRPAISRAALIESMQGCITAESHADDAPDLSPDELAADWTADLPDEP